MDVQTRGGGNFIRNLAPQEPWAAVWTSLTCYTLEVSFFSYQTNTTGQSMPYTEEAYMKLGRNLARTFLDYYKLTGFISAKPSSSILPKPIVGQSRHRDKGNASERAVSEPLGRPERRDERLNRKSSDLQMTSPNSYSDLPSSIRVQRDGRRM